MFLPDFRASERTFQLLTQVSGRAGRREERGEVVIQTYNPENIALISSRKHDFELLYNNIIESRKELGYPPFSRLILVRFKHNNSNICEKEAKEFAAKLKRSNLDAQIMGPTPSVLFRVQNNYRFQILIKIRNRSSKNLKTIKTELKKLTMEQKPTKSRLSIDVDPFDMI